MQNQFRDLLNLRVSRSSDEILNVIKKIYIDSSDVTLWQNQNGRRLIARAIIDKIDFSKNRMILIADKCFSNEFPTYMRSESENLLFKQQQCPVSANKVAIKIPKEVRLKENRHIKRIDTPKGIVFNAIFDKRVGVGAGSQRSFSTRIINISTHGLCLEFLQNLGKFFYEGDQIILSSINNLSFEPSIEASVIYIQKHQSSSERLRMGVRLKTPLSQQQLALISKDHPHYIRKINRPE